MDSLSVHIVAVEAESRERSNMSEITDIDNLEPMPLILGGEAEYERHINNEERFAPIEERLDDIECHCATLQRDMEEAFDELEEISNRNKEIGDERAFFNGQIQTLSQRINTLHIWLGISAILWLTTIVHTLHK